MAGRNAMTLKQFMLRSEVLKLYRNILRTVKEIPDDYYRNEMAKWARDDFRKNKHLTDEMAIKMMISKGKMSLKELEQSIVHAKWFDKNRIFKSNISIYG
ncbi:LYR motif-containing protein 2 [Mactra antiquata]